MPQDNQTRLLLQVDGKILKYIEASELHRRLVAGEQFKIGGRWPITKFGINQTPGPFDGYYYFHCDAAEMDLPKGETLGVASAND